MADIIRESNTINTQDHNAMTQKKLNADYDTAYKRLSDLIAIERKTKKHTPRDMQFMAALDYFIRRIISLKTKPTDLLDDLMEGKISLTDFTKVLNATSDLLEHKITPDNYLSLANEVHGKPNKCMRALGVAMWIMFALSFVATMALIATGGPLALFIVCLVSIFIFEIAACLTVNVGFQHGLSASVSTLGEAAQTYDPAQKNHSMFFQQNSEIEMQSLPPIQPDYEVSQNTAA